MRSSLRSRQSVRGRLLAKAGGGVIDPKRQRRTSHYGVFCRESEQAQCPGIGEAEGRAVTLLPHCLHLLDARGRVLVEPLLAVACKSLEVEPTLPTHALGSAALSQVHGLGFRHASLLDLLADRSVCALKLALPALAPRGEVHAWVNWAARVWVEDGYKNTTLLWNGNLGRHAILHLNAEASVLLGEVSLSQLCGGAILAVCRLWCR
eukprot:5628512-Pleurochrysis_carterae.AAC.9